jgi:hypothetical protein
MAALVLKESRVLKGSRVLLDQMAALVLKVFKEHKDSRVLLVHKVRKESRALLVLVCKELKVFKVLLDLQEQQTVQRSTYSLVVSALELRRVLLLTKLKQ